MFATWYSDVHVQQQVSTEIFSDTSESEAGFKLGLQRMIVFIIDKWFCMEIVQKSPSQSPQAGNVFVGLEVQNPKIFSSQNEIKLRKATNTNWYQEMFGIFSWKVAQMIKQ